MCCTTEDNLNSIPSNIGGHIRKQSNCISIFMNVSMLNLKFSFDINYLYYLLLVIRIECMYIYVLLI